MEDGGLWIEILTTPPGTSSDKTIDALYAFTDCEINISPNCCIIRDNKPEFLTVSKLRNSAEHTKGIAEIRVRDPQARLEEQLFYISLERIFIETVSTKSVSLRRQRPRWGCYFRWFKLEPYKENLHSWGNTRDIIRLLKSRCNAFWNSTGQSDELIQKMGRSCRDWQISARW